MFVFLADSTTPPEPAEPARYERLLELPPSAKLVYLVLANEGPLTQQQLCDRTRLAPRTARYALTDLRSADLVDHSVYVPDARKRLYQATPVTTPPE
ncbi:MarR family transcriptional regulator [Halomarina pelagica]|uniref:MarR family transcriptional regulator n=1 Tax=Halomarina pelagica TaxID=2961599 RepID=UPI0020C53529|nr:helix-turn-helix domain-containing protein [Halomarina sp. BND7]